MNTGCVSEVQRSNRLDAARGNHARGSQALSRHPQSSQATWCKDGWVVKVTCRSPPWEVRAAASGGRHEQRCILHERCNDTTVQPHQGCRAEWPQKITAFPVAPFGGPKRRYSRVRTRGFEPPPSQLRTRSLVWRVCQFRHVRSLL